MKFNQIIIEKLNSFLIQNGFKLTDQFENFFKFSSAFVDIAVSYNEFDKTNLIEVGRKNSFLYPINDKLINNVFNSLIKIDQLPNDTFVNNVCFFLETDGIEIINGDSAVLSAIKEFVTLESEEYTKRLRI